MKKRLPNNIFLSCIFITICLQVSGNTKFLDSPPLSGKILKLIDTPGKYSYKTEIIKYKTEDGASIEATLLTPETDELKPGVVYVHMWARDRNTFWGLPEYLATFGYPGIYMDLRGHGKSKFPHSNKKVTIKDKKLKYDSLYKDILPAISIMLTHKNCKDKKLIAIGASLGCPLSIIAVSHYKDNFIALIQMAPSYIYFDVNCKSEIEKVKTIPILVFADKKDKSYNKAKSFFSYFESYKSLIQTDGIGHGTDILYQNLGFPTIMHNWIEHIRLLEPVLKTINKKIYKKRNGKS